MLIYNHLKEFVGIDEHDLKLLGFESLLELREESADFADMFVKTPGHVHNFQHVNWIDFVTCADSTESTKVIIHAKSRNFRCLLDIKTAYLTDNTSSKAFLIYLTNIRELTSNENGDISGELLEKVVPEVVPDYIPAKKEAFEELLQELAPTEEETIEIPQEHYDTPIDLDIPLEINFDDEISNDSIDLNFEEETPHEVTPDVKIKAAAPKEEFQTSKEIFDNGYIFDPQVASDELGLPVDLIEEFIEDFIAQAKEFKDDLYQALNDGDSDNLKIFSHKLKGVAANLRIEDALESLTIVNTAEDVDEIKTHLDTLYKIIKKLSGEKIDVTRSIHTETSQSTVDTDVAPLEYQEEASPHDFDDIDIFASPKIETPKIETPKIETPKIEIPEVKTIEDKDVPLKIALPELADDNFLDHENLFADVQATTPDEPKAPQVKTINYDVKYIASEIGLSQEHFTELFEDYIVEAQEISSTISHAIKEDKHSLWKRKALQLKGMGDNMRIKELTQDLETLIKTQDSQIAKNANSSIIDTITTLSKIKG